MKIHNIDKIPKFIGLYFNKDMIDLETINRFIKSLEYSSIEKYNDENIYRINYDPIDDNKFLNFYFLKSRVNLNNKCLYEEELEIPKSISENECFTGIIDDEEVKFSFIGLENNYLYILKIDNLE